LVQFNIHQLLVELLERGFILLKLQYRYRVGVSIEIVLIEPGINKLREPRVMLYGLVRDELVQFAVQNTAQFLHKSPRQLAASAWRLCVLDLLQEFVERGLVVRELGQVHFLSL
jgi:hypothetical protein